jgi:hypothetical protein
MSMQDYEARHFDNTGVPQYVFKLPIRLLPVFKCLRKYLNKDGWTMRLRGSNLDKWKAYDDGWTSNQYTHAVNCGAIPLKLAKEFRVYFYRR